MRKILISAAAAAAVALSASPAAAQSRNHDRYEQHDRGWGNHQRGPNRQAVNQLLRDLDRVESRIDRSFQRRAISAREAQSLRREAANVRQRVLRASRDGLSHREFANLRERVNRLEHRLREERRDRDGRRW